MVQIAGLVAPGSSTNHALRLITCSGDSGSCNESGDVMAIGSAAAIRRTARARASVTDGMTQNPTTEIAADDVRTLIADHLGVDIARVTDEAHLADDLGADWLDRLELMIVIEDRFGDVEISDDDVDRIDVVGDLIRHVESASRERRRGAVRRQ